MPDICPPGECLKERLMELLAKQQREFQNLGEYWDERAEELQQRWDATMTELQRGWDASAAKLLRDLELMAASANIDPDTLERWLGQRKEIAALRRQVAELRREIEALRGVRNGARRGNGAN
jgi:hypothetical protein